MTNMKMQMIKMIINNNLYHTYLPCNNYYIHLIYGTINGHKHTFQ